MGSVLRPADEEPGGEEHLQGVPADRVQRGEHALLAGMRGPEAGAEHQCHAGEGTAHL